MDDERRKDEVTIPICGAFIPKWPHNRIRLNIGKNSKPYCPLESTGNVALHGSNDSKLLFSVHLPVAVLITNILQLLDHCESERFET